MGGKEVFVEEKRTTTRGKQKQIFLIRLTTDGYFLLVLECVCRVQYTKKINRDSELNQWHSLALF